MFREKIGGSTRERLNTLIHDLILCSRGKNSIEMSEEMERQMFSLRSFMYENVYRNPAARGEEEKAVHLLQRLYDYYSSHPELMSQEYISLIRDRGEKKERVVCDYIAGMTDSYANYVFTELFVPQITY